MRTDVAFEIEIIFQHKQHRPFSHRQSPIGSNMNPQSSNQTDRSMVNSDETLLWKLIDPNTFPRINISNSRLGAVFCECYNWIPRELSCGTRLRGGFCCKKRKWLFIVFRSASRRCRKYLILRYRIIYSISAPKYDNVDVNRFMWFIPTFA